jgi:hypothetical protein
MRQRITGSVSEGRPVSAATVIRNADALLPGVPTDGQDQRWKAIIAVGEYIESEPEAVWQFICRWGGHLQEDLRDAIATCLLEHLLEYHFVRYFPQVEHLALTDPMFADTFQRCWRFGPTPESGNAEQFIWLAERLRGASRA